MGTLDWVGVGAAGAVWIGALISVIRATGYRAGTMLVWTIVVVFLGPVGALLYLGFGHGRPVPPPGSREVAPRDRKARLAAIANPWQEAVPALTESWWDGPE